MDIDGTLVRLGASAFTSAVLEADKMPRLTIRVNKIAEPVPAPAPQPRPTLASLNPHALTSAENVAVPNDGDDSPVEKILLHVVTGCGRRESFSMRRNLPLRRIVRVLAARLGLTEDDIDLVYEGSRLSYDDTPDTLEMDYGDTMECHMVQRGGKPIIYLQTPTHLPSVDVSLLLVPELAIQRRLPA